MTLGMSLGEHGASDSALNESNIDVH